MTENFYSIEAEEAILGSVLLDGSLIKVVDLMPDEFYIQRHAIIFGAMKRVSETGTAIDLITLSERLKAMNQLDTIGGLAVLSGLVNSTATTMHFEHYTKLVRDKANRRRAVQVAKEIANAAAQEDDFIIGQYITRLMETERGQTQTVHISDGVRTFDKWLDSRIEMRKAGQMDSLPTTHLQGLDDVLLYLEPGQVTILAGEPGVGKTMLAQQIVESNPQIKRVIFSLEMSEHRLVGRMISARSNVPVSAMRRGLPGDNGAYYDRIISAYEKIEHEGVYLNCSSRMTCENIYSELVKLKAQGQDIQLAVIDYFGLIEDNSTAENKTIREEIISGKLTRMAKELNVHLLVVDAYNKAGFGHSKGSMGRVSGAARKGYNADNMITLTLGDSTIAGQQVFADIVKARDGEISSARVALLREKGTPKYRQMTSVEVANLIEEEKK